MPNNGVKFSQFPSVATINNSDQIVGLHEGANARWSFSTVLSWFQSAVSGLFVPTSRKVNNKALSADITLTPSDVGAVPTTSVGVASGVASLDSSGKVPSAQLPPIASTAADVTYDNTQSGLTADDVQEALDELAAGAGGSTAATTSYDNTTSGLAATNAQDAIDELVDEKVYQYSVAEVESTFTAALPHPIGSLFFVPGNVLCRAKVDISVGDTISNLNTEETTVDGNFMRTVTLTSAQYAQLSAAEKAADVLYVITDDPVAESYPNGSITLLTNNGYISATSLSACDRSGSLVAIAISINLAGTIPTTRCEFGTLHGVPKPRANTAGLFQITNYLFAIQIAVNGKVYITSIGQAQGASTWSGTPLLTYSTDGTILS